MTKEYVLPTSTEESPLLSVNNLDGNNGLPKRSTIPPGVRRLAVCVALIAICVSALAVHGHGTTSSENKLVMGLILACVVLFAIFPYTPKVPVEAIIRPLSTPLGVLGSRKGSLVAMVLVLVLIGGVSMALPAESGSARGLRAQGGLGLIVFLAALWATSKDRANIEWRTVWVGIFIQFLMALFVLRTAVGFNIFHWLATKISMYLGYSEQGYAFLFAQHGPTNLTYSLTPFNATTIDYTTVYVNEDLTFRASTFAANVFPAIIFFCATVELLYYFGILQAVIRKFAAFFLYLMGTSGAESTVAAASPFIGQGENALLVRPFVAEMTRSELHQIMASGFATISGSVLFAYIQLGVSAQYLITAAMMSVPCALALSKMRYPETEVPLTKGEVKEIPVDEAHAAKNALQALGGGAKTGMEISLIIAASLIAVLSLLAAVNGFLSWLGMFYAIENLTLSTILRYPFYPISWVMGVAWADVPLVSELLALKIVANEFVAYDMFANQIKSQVSEHSGVIITYALCGFANFSSIGIQIGVLGAIAPTRVSDLSELALSAMLTGAASTCFSAILAGMLF